MLKCEVSAPFHTNLEARAHVPHHTLAEYLFMGENEFSGSLPTELGSLSNLSTCFLFPVRREMPCRLIIICLMSGQPICIFKRII